jgi:hypothetical protein
LLKQKIHANLVLAMARLWHDTGTCSIMREGALNTAAASWGKIVASMINADYSSANVLCCFHSCIQHMHVIRCTPMRCMIAV